MHIHGQTLDRLRTGRLTPAEDAALHRHVAICLSCAETLAAVAIADARWERRGVLGRLVRVDGRRTASAT